MSRQQISHSGDLLRLQNEGYELELKGGYLLIHHIPYVDGNCQVKLGVLVYQIAFLGSEVVKPGVHTAYFIGDKPCNRDGTPIVEMINNSNTVDLGNGIIVNHYFSSKPPRGFYIDHYEKVSTYVHLLSDPAASINGNMTAKTFKPILCEEEDSPFYYEDTNSTRANLNRLNQKFKGQRIAIIGLGGTGSYVLDFVSKTPVQEIFLYDEDEFLQHNAFRSPGAASVSVLSADPRIKKITYFKGIYSNIHRNIQAKDSYVTCVNIHELKGMSYVFICVDRGSLKKEIIQGLIAMGITFIDVGMGINVIDDKLIGMARVTTGIAGNLDHVEKRISFEDDENDEYASNIQIAELNALNASLAVVKWKKLCGFYQDLKGELNSTYVINTSQLLNDDITT